MPGAFPILLASLLVSAPASAVSLNEDLQFQPDLCKMHLSACPLTIWQMATTMPILTPST